MYNQIYIYIYKRWRLCTCIHIVHVEGRQFSFVGRMKDRCSRWVCEEVII